VSSTQAWPYGQSISHLGADGVFRVIHSSSYDVIDAVRLSTAQIKDVVDRWPFDQAIEDKFRGVDGRGVSDKDMFDPPEEIRLKRPTEEQLQEFQRINDQQKRKGVKKGSNTVCGLRKSNYPFSCHQRCLVRALGIIVFPEEHQNLRFLFTCK
jgi:hypothetical protein